MVCKIALHKKNVKLRNETLPLHKKNVKLHIFLVTRPPLARPPLVSAEAAIAKVLAEIQGKFDPSFARDSKSFKDFFSALRAKEESHYFRGWGFSKCW